MDLVGELNIRASNPVPNPQFGAAKAANQWAGTTNLELVGALNAKNGTTGLELAGVLTALGVNRDGQ